MKDAERNKAQELFGTYDAPTELAQSIISVRSNKPFTAAPTVNGGSKGQKMNLTENEKKKFDALVRKAKTLAEIQKLEKMLAEGKLPAEVLDEGDAMDET